MAHYTPTFRGLKPRGCEIEKMGAKMGTGTVFAWLVLLLLLSPFAGAAVGLPLDGYCRPGRFFPVVVDAADARASLVLSADGCLPTQIEPAGDSSRIVPMLAFGDPHELHWPGGSLPLRSVAGNERLIGSAASDPPADLFPHTRLIPIHLDPADPLPGPPAVWETLDAIVLDAADFSRIDDMHRSTWLAGGVTLVARGTRPDARWPWQKHDGYWILRANIAGPHDDLIDDAAYAPTFTWQPGWSGRVCAQAVGAAAVLLLVILSVLLVGRGSPTAGGVVVALCLIAGGLVIIWRRSLGSVDQAGGDVLIAGDHLLQRDSWVYQRAKESGEIQVPWTGSTHPILASLGGLAGSGMQLHASAIGQLRFTYAGSPGHCLAFLRRQLLLEDIPPILPGNRSPMQEAAKAMYLGPGLKVLGETSGEGTRWAGVVVGPVDSHTP
jgi:hypothetical protein